jgi:hypothetical protein
LSIKELENSPIVEDTEPLEEFKPELTKELDTLITAKYKLN